MTYKKLKMPEISSSSEPCIVTEWYVSENDIVDEGQDVLEISSDKATFDIESPYRGRIVLVLKNKGSRVFPGEVLAEISDSTEKGPCGNN